MRSKYTASTDKYNDKLTKRINSKCIDISARLNDSFGNGRCREMLIGVRWDGTHQYSAGRAVLLKCS